MSRRFYLIVLAVLLIGVQPAFAQDAGKPTVDLGEVSDEELFKALDSASEIELINKNDLNREKESGTKTASDTEKVPSDIQNNKYFLESQRLAKLAEDAYSYGDFDSSANFAEESIRNAQRSDEYVARRLKGESEENIIAALDAVLETSPLPATYTVRDWGSTKDCFWNIAEYPWVYGNPHQWRRLYEANKSKLPDPDNPNIIDPGIVLDIPSLKGETRQGAWDENKTYEPIN